MQGSININAVRVAQDPIVVTTTVTGIRHSETIGLVVVKHFLLSDVILAVSVLVQRHV